MNELAFHPVTLEDAHAVRAACLAAGERSCQYNFANLFCLRGLYGTEVAWNDSGALFIRQSKRELGRVAYLPPLGMAWEDALALLRAEGRPWSFFGVTAEDKDALEQAAPGALRFTADRDWAEYLYESQTMSTLPGNHLGQRRRDARICRTAYGDRLRQEPMSRENFEEVYAFQQEWLTLRGGENQQPDHLDWENVAIREALDHFEELDLRGMLLRIDGAVVAYSYGCPVGGETFDVIAQKADSRVRHLYRVISQEYATAYCLPYRWLNAEEDLGLPGLRLLKMTYRPKLLLGKWRAEPEEST